LKEAADQGNARPQNSLAWLFAACKNPQYHNGMKAVEYAAKAVSQEPKRWFFVDTLSCAYARNGQFDDAVATGQRAIELLRGDDYLPASEKEDRVAEMMKRLEMFNNRQPFTDPNS
jgi:hypothetical protein